MARRRIRQASSLGRVIMTSRAGVDQTLRSDDGECGDLGRTDLRVLLSIEIGPPLGEAMVQLLCFLRRRPDRVGVLVRCVQEACRLLLPIRDLTFQPVSNQVPSPSDVSAPVVAYLPTRGAGRHSLPKPQRY